MPIESCKMSMLITMHLCVFKTTFANKCLNETTEVVRDIKRHHTNIGFANNSNFSFTTCIWISL